MGKIELQGKPICITGASAGIGRATALECARRGMAVMVSARREEKLAELVGEIERAGGRAPSFAADVADAEACAALVAKTEEAFGSIYGVFANAGYGVERAMHEMTDEELRAIFETNFWGTMNVVRPAMERMIAQRAGHALICSSCVAKFALPYYGAYAATKGAQNLVGRAMRLEVEPHGVHVSTVHPIGTKTEFFEVTKERSGTAKLVEHAPERFLQRPETVARAIVRALERPRAEVWTSRFVRFGMAVCTMFPGMGDAAVRGMVKKRLAHAGEAASGS